MFANSVSSCTTAGKMTKVKKTVEPSQRKRETVFSCVLCQRSLKGPPSLRRHLLHVHPAKVLVESCAVAGPHGFTADKLQLLVKGVPQDDEIYLAEDRRFGGKAKRSESSSIVSLSPGDRFDLTVLSDQDAGMDISARGRSILFVRSVQIGSPVSLDPSTASAPQKPRIPRSGSTERPVLGNPTRPRLLGGSGKTLERILREISQGIRRYRGPEEASDLDEALERAMPDVDRPLRSALTMAYFQGCADTATVGERLIVGADNRFRRAADVQKSSAGLSRSAAEAEERFDRLAAGFGYVEACLTPGSSVADNLLDTVPRGSISGDIVDLSGGGGDIQRETGNDASGRAVDNSGRNDGDRRSEAGSGDIGDSCGGRDIRRETGSGASGRAVDNTERSGGEIVDISSGGDIRRGAGGDDSGGASQ